MKKLIFTALIAICFIPAICQTKTITIAKERIGPISCSIEDEINVDTKDTSTKVILYFQNAKYSAITDIALLLFYKNSADEINQFIKDLKVAYEEMEKKQSIDWTRESYSIYMYDFNKQLYISEPSKRGSGYTTLSKKQVGKLILWLEEYAAK